MAYAAFNPSAALFMQTQHAERNVLPLTLEVCMGTSLTAFPRSRKRVVQNGCYSDVKHKNFVLSRHHVLACVENGTGTGAAANIAAVNT